MTSVCEKVTSFPVLEKKIVSDSHQVMWISEGLWFVPTSSNLI